MQRKFACYFFTLRIEKYDFYRIFGILKEMLIAITEKEACREQG